ncbi:MAG: hypothetical protein NTU97_01480 [Candidatus Magasanikbacteria bacterium]|nr:hypothetical protein [Candidatus Magasanikbacteria bacterium]
MEQDQPQPLSSNFLLWLSLSVLALILAVCSLIGFFSPDGAWTPRPSVLEVDKVGDWTLQERINTACESGRLPPEKCGKKFNSVIVSASAEVESPLDETAGTTQEEWCELRSQSFAKPHSLLYECQIEQAMNACSLPTDNSLSAGDDALEQEAIFNRTEQRYYQWAAMASTVWFADGKVVTASLAHQYGQCTHCYHSSVSDMDFRMAAIQLAGCELRLLACGSRFSGLTYDQVQEQQRREWLMRQTCPPRTRKFKALLLGDGDADSFGRTGTANAHFMDM